MHQRGHFSNSFFWNLFYLIFLTVQFLLLLKIHWKEIDWLVLFLAKLKVKLLPQRLVNAMSHVINVPHTSRRSVDQVRKQINILSFWWIKLTLISFSDILVDINWPHMPLRSRRPEDFVFLRIIFVFKIEQVFHIWLFLVRIMNSLLTYSSRTIRDKRFI